MVHARIFGLLVLAGLTSTGVARAEESGSGRFAVGGMLGYGVGASLGGDYERCDPARCSEHQLPATGFVSGRAGYTLASGLGFELEVGSVTGIHMKNRRETTLLGEQQVPVAVDIKDEVSAGGVFVSVGASYTFVRKPVIGAFAFGIGQWWASADATRNGTAVTDAEPSPRTMKANQAETVTSTITVIVPELRFGYPLGEHFEIGIGLGAFAALGGELRPKVVQTPQATATDTQPKTGGKTIGFLPQPNATPETALETFVSFRGSVYLRMPF